ncbi:MAG: exopolysaccharide biosynthesis polyprenyl glycosylphosphotransferase [Hyphomicrobiaceae bacterium]|nr:exopolysaccharide biosynthesis polyprenyl glycosylphosphotransferase [Hyphomicrobiaceae bacterium]
MQLEDAVRTARLDNVQDVIISSGCNGAFTEKAVAAFSLLPIVVHLGTGGLVGQFKHARISRFGRKTTLSLTREPIGPLQAASKRTFDVVFASTALVLLLPFLGFVALAIKLDSPGPVFFRQRRRGYNLGEFRMWKFRTMTTLDDGDIIKQAKQGDKRITRVGRVLRKFSIDELPQLLNVIAGDMSLVGPRPHAVAHDRFFEKRIEKYPRRLNVKPGITGWAQVNGFRGATDTDDSMHQRVEHDLYYIDNWSLLFDVYIIVLTVISRKTFRNAY